MKSLAVTLLLALFLIHKHSEFQLTPPLPLILLRLFFHLIRLLLLLPLQYLILFLILQTDFLSSHDNQQMYLEKNEDFFSY
jgi:hypothetical protein